MTSYSISTLTWGAYTPPQMAGISTKGPAGVPFACTPAVPAQQFTYIWSVLGNGCPAGYGFNVPESSCLFTGVYNTQHWGCTWTAGAVVTTTVNGGTVTAPAGVPATVTDPVQWITVTQTQRITNTVTSTVNPPAVTVTVTSTQGAQKRSEGRPWDRGMQLPHQAVEILKADKADNLTEVSLDRRAVCPVNEFACTTNSCCYNGQACVGPGVYCCNGYECVNFDKLAPFTYLPATPWNGYTITTTLISTKLVIITVNPPGSTITIKPTSTTQLNVVETSTVNTIITALVQTVTAVIVVQLAPSGQPGPATTITQPIVVTTQSAPAQSLDSGGIPTSPAQSQVGGGIPTSPAQSQGGSGATTSPAQSQGGSGATTSPAQSQGGSGAATSQGGSLTTTQVQEIGGSSTSSAGNSNTTIVVTNSNNDLAVKIGAGVGVPLVAALIGALIFIFLRRRKQKPDQHLNEPEGVAVAGAAAGAGAGAGAVAAAAAARHNEMEGEFFAEKPALSVYPATPISPATPVRPVSELPPYSSPTMAAATIPRRPVGSPEAIDRRSVGSPTLSSTSNTSELPDRTYGVPGFEGYPRPQQAGYSQNQGYPVNEFGTPANAHEMSANIREFYELPGHYGA